jgi:PAS domain S-box-containing protein
MSSIQPENRAEGLSVRDYLVNKFQFIHLRLLKFYRAHNDKADEGEIRDAAQLFIEQLPTAVFFVNLEGRFLYGNKKAEELSGYSRQEVIGKRYYETNFVGLNDLIKIASLFAAHVFDQSTGPYNFTLRRKDGNRIRVELLIRLTTFHGSRVILCVVREVQGPESREHEAKEDQELHRRLSQLNRGMSQISMCLDCKKVQSAENEWIPIEYFLYKQLELAFSHGYCPSCFEKKMGKL